MRPEKELLLDEFKEKLNKSQALFVTRYQKMTPNLAADFRQMIGKSGGDFEVMRKRILLKAASASGIHFPKELLIGHVGIVFVEKDPIEVTKAFYRFSKDHDEVFQVLTGCFEGRVCSSNDVKAISELPSKDEMRAQFLGLLEAPLSTTLAVMDSLLTSVIYCLENKSQSGSEETN